MGEVLEDFSGVGMTVHCEHPNSRIHSFQGTLFVHAEETEEGEEEGKGEGGERSIAVEAPSLLLR